MFVLQLILQESHQGHVERYVRETPLIQLDISRQLEEFDGKCGQRVLAVSSWRKGAKVLVPARQHDTWVQGAVIKKEGDQVFVRIKAAGGAGEEVVTRSPARKLFAL